MASSESDSQLKIVHGEAGYILEDVPHLSDYVSNLPVSLSILSWIFFGDICDRIQFQFSCVILGFVCRHIQIRCDPIQLTRLLSKWITLFSVVIVIWVSNVFCSKYWFSVFFFAAPGSISCTRTTPFLRRFYSCRLPVCSFLHLIYLERFYYTFFCAITWSIKHQTWNSFHRFLILN